MLQSPNTVNFRKMITKSKIGRRIRRPFIVYLALLALGSPVLILKDTLPHCTEACDDKPCKNVLAEEQAS